MCPTSISKKHTHAGMNDESAILVGCYMAMVALLAGLLYTYCNDLLVPALEIIK